MASEPIGRGNGAGRQVVRTLAEFDFSSQSLSTNWGINRYMWVHKEFPHIPNLAETDRMTTATASDKLRQIAILVSSVDATAARQILLHLPTDKARRVRELASQLGPVRPEERRQILAEFQRSAASASSVDRRPLEQPDSTVATVTARAEPSTAEAHLGNLNHSEASAPSHDSSMLRTGWARLSPSALLRFVRHERPAVTAVVISQLAPTVAVEVLRHLPGDISREVLLRLSRLREIDPEAMRAIDEHLTQRLGEYEHHLESELENTRRIEALLAAAPAEVRHHWSAILADGDRLHAWQTPSTQSAVKSSTGTESVASSQAAPVTDVLDLSDDRLTTDNRRQPLAATAVPAQAVESETAPPASNSDTADILPFPTAPRQSQSEVIDRSLIQIEFEQILHLPPWMLAELLTNTDSQVVLLALAGATPQFMKRFMHMLDRRDARALQNRLQRIGPIRLRDVDEAQRQIVENAARWAKAQSTQPQMQSQPMQRAAA